MKAAPVMRALEERGAQQTLVHTGQHYDANMSDVFFAQLAMAAPDVNLEAGSGSHAKQTADIMSRFEPVVLERNPDVVVVYGDVNSTVAADVGVLETNGSCRPRGSGAALLRSHDAGRGEPLGNRPTGGPLVHAFRGRRYEFATRGRFSEKIHLVGNVMIDSLVRLLPVAERQKMNGLPPRYALVTLHRPSNVDDPRV